MAHGLFLIKSQQYSDINKETTEMLYLLNNERIL